MKSICKVSDMYGCVIFFLMVWFVQYVCVAFISVRAFSGHTGTYIIEWGRISSLQEFFLLVFCTSYPWAVLGSIGLTSVRLFDFWDKRIAMMFFVVAQVIYTACQFAALHDVAWIFYKETGSTWRYWELPLSLLSDPVAFLCFLFSIPAVATIVWLFFPNRSASV